MRRGKIHFAAGGNAPEGEVTTRGADNNRVENGENPSLSKLIIQSGRGRNEH